MVPGPNITVTENDRTFECRDGLVVSDKPVDIVAPEPADEPQPEMPEKPGA